ncbi:hypothetical protein VNO78_16682 [Psophocarpus tetragonolobus]|uniref:Uncharacterized protein n=1 Tax=Psophocarpus tetragonolobus TaxID=3891 RepID=A0AAN9SHH2_PSOTE
MNKTIENSLSPEEHRKRFEEEKANYAHIHNLYSYESETSNMELDNLTRTMLEADTALKARAEQEKLARKLMEERQAKKFAAKTAIQKAILELEY